MVITEQKYFFFQYEISLKKNYVLEVFFLLKTLVYMEKISYLCKRKYEGIYNLCCNTNLSFLYVYSVRVVLYTQHVS
jgi:hypothetical protein